jgi:hypothetical protein
MQTAPLALLFDVVWKTHRRSIMPTQQPFRPQLILLAHFHVRRRRRVEPLLPETGIATSNGVAGAAAARMNEIALSRL